MGILRAILVSAIIGALVAQSGRAAPPAAPDFARDVAPIFAKYCAGCHNGSDRESGLSLDSFADLQKGGDRGAVVVPGRADASMMIRVLSGDVEPAMPPEDNPRPNDAEIDLLRRWIDSGAAGPDGAEPLYPEVAAPEVAPSVDAKPYLTCLALAPDGKRLALGSYRRVELIDAETQKIVATTESIPGKVHNVAFSRDGSLFIASSGIPGLYGAATLCRTSDGSIVMQLKGHRDALYDAELSPDGRHLATCSYDRQISLWNVDTGELVRTLSGHNGAVYELAFTADGATLASASADQTVKIWDVATGERLDTLGQPEGEQHAVAISPDGKSIVAGGADRQLRMWRLVSLGRPQINPLVHSRAGHESTIVKIAYAPDGHTLVSASEGRELILWDTAKLTPRHRFERQPDVVTGIAFEPEGKHFYVARLDGSWQKYPIETEPGNDRGKPGITATPTLAGSSSAPQQNAARLKVTEQEPNNSPATANKATDRATVSGVISATADGGEPDVDLFRFHARRGQQCVLEIKTAKQKSPLDSRIKVLDAAGNSIPRVVLQAVRPTYFTFRGRNSTDLNDYRLHGWQDMELNEYLYANGEVVKLWLYPRGPDSGFIVYPGFAGNRFTYFGTTAVTHAVNEPCYIVEPHQPGTTLIPNGLPQFTLFYENDDDGWRKPGTDSRVLFTAPADGEYLVRISDVRGWGGDDYRYKLTLREPRPDFNIKLDAPDLTINAGSGKEITIQALRQDEFDGEIHVEVSGLPPGFHISSPLVIEAGQNTAYATITADADAPAPTAENAKSTRITASALIHGEQIVKEPIDLGELKLAAKPAVLIHISPLAVAAAAENSADSSRAVELVIAPGETISAVVKVERNGHDGDIGFGTEFAGRNLPHGVYVDNIGLNGLLLLQGETERTFFITAAKWVPETVRPFHLRTDAGGNQTSWPVVLHVRNRRDAPKLISTTTPPVE